MILHRFLKINNVDWAVWLFWKSTIWIKLYCFFKNQPYRLSRIAFLRTFHGSLSRLFWYFTTFLNDFSKFLVKCNIVWSVLSFFNIFGLSLVGYSAWYDMPFLFEFLDSSEITIWFETGYPLMHFVKRTWCLIFSVTCNGFYDFMISFSSSAYFAFHHDFRKTYFYISTFNLRLL